MGETEPSLRRVFFSFWIHFLYHYVKVFGGLWLILLLVEVLLRWSAREAFDPEFKLGLFGILLAGLAVFSSGCTALAYTNAIRRERRK